MFRQLARQAKAMKREIEALALAARDPRLPRHVKLAALAVVAYALSPIDLVPDFIPVLGHLDDLILVPLGIWLVLRMIPPEILAEHRRAAEAASFRAPSLAGAALVALVWIAAAVWLGRLALGC